MGIQGRAASRHQMIGRTQADSGQLLIRGASDGFETSLMSSSASSNDEPPTTYSTESEADARLRQHHHRQHHQQQQQAFRASHPAEQCPHRRYLSSDGEISIPSNSSRPVSDRVHEPPFVKQAPLIGSSGAAGCQFDSFEANSSSSCDQQPLHQQPLHHQHHQHHQHEHHNHNHKHEQLQRLQHQLQHRQLQAHVHQQLQRIYGDRSKRAHQEREQQHSVSAAAAASSQQQLLSRHGKQLQNQQLEQQIQPRDEQHDNHSRDGFSSHEKLYTNKLASTSARQQHQQPFKVDYNNGNTRQQQHNDTANGQRGARAEQIYDLLSPPSRAANKQLQQPQPQPQPHSARRQTTSKSSRHQLRGARAAGAPIGAIPEESDSELGGNVMLDDVDDDDDGDEQDDDDDRDDDEHFLVPGELVSPPAGARKSVVVRKSQLANLHYATVTAAALLSATANAAAAIAATDKQFNRVGGGIQQQQPPQQKQQPVASSAGQRSSRATKSAPISSSESAVNRGYSNPDYQELTKRPCCQHELDQQKMRCVHQQQQQQQQPQTSHQVKQRAPGPSIVYRGGPANSNAAMNPLHYQAVPATYGAPYHQMLRAHHNSHNLYNPRNSQQQQQQQQLMQHAKQMHHYHQALLSNRPIPPQPPARRPVTLVMSPGGGVAARQDARFALIPKQARLMAGPQLMPPANGAPAPIGPTALAVIHTGGGGKNASAKADLISRLLINNMVAAQSMAAEMNYAKLSQLRSSLEQVHGFQPIRELVSHGARPREKVHSAAIGQPAVFGLPAGRAPSDSSGNSSVPLVVNRDIAPVSFIERVCRIDLTLFWWSLLIISLLFVGIIITISRYVF